MNDSFEQMQRRWRRHALINSRTQAQLTTDVQKALKKHRSETRMALTGGLIALIVVSLTNYYVFRQFQTGRSALFKVSLILIELVVLANCLVLIRSILFDREGVHQSSLKFIKVQLAGVRWKIRAVKKFTPAFFVALWSCMMLYCYEITRETSVGFTFLAPASITIYTLVVFLLVNLKSKSQTEQLTSLVTTLEVIEDELEKNS